MSLFPAYGSGSSSTKSSLKSTKERVVDNTKEEGETDDEPEPSFSIDTRGNKDDYLVTIDSSDDCGQEIVEIQEKKAKKKSKKSREHRRKHDKGRKHSRSRSREREYSRSSDLNNQSGSNYNNNHRRYDSGGYEERGNYDRREHERYRNNRDRDYDRDQWRNKHRNQEEEYRLRVSQQFPKKTFMEEVDLRPEYAFRVDTQATHTNLSFRCLSTYHTPRYYPQHGNVVGATSEDLNKIYRFQPKFRCLPPPGIDEQGNTVDSDGLEADDGPMISKRRKKAEKADVPISSSVEFLSFSGPKRKNANNSDNRFDLKSDFESYSFSRKEGDMGIKDKVEYYNSQVRKTPKNIQLWKEFVQFQDQVFEESDQIFDNTDSVSGSKKKGGKKKNRKALVEKKIAILEKAIESNPKSLELHMCRMEYLYEIYKPRFVLTEWKKLVTSYQQISSFWLEYLRFASTQLQLFSHDSIVDVYSKCFQKFKQMLNPNYSTFQRPDKFILLMSDIYLCLTIILKSSGYMEKAIAMHQAQLEMDFYCPVEMLKDKSKQDWNEISDLFGRFWDAGTLRYGEPGALGWSTCMKNKPKTKCLLGVPDSKVAELEDTYFESVSESNEDLKSINWLFIESSRSTLYWLPWRASFSDSDDCDDSQRIISASDLTPFAFPIPDVSFISSFEVQSAHFRHVVNFLLLLRQDFIPSTHTLDSLLSAFTSTSLSDTQILIDEIFYWKKHLEFYYSGSSTSESSIIPEGFLLAESTIPNRKIVKSDTNLTMEDHTIRHSDTVEKLKQDVFSENYSKYDEMLQNVVESSIDNLSQPFASLLAEMFFRFQQKCSRTCSQDHKARMKFSRNLLKKEKLRNCTNLYCEVALIEYFKGNKTKAIALLLKTVNTSSKAFSDDDMDVDLNWEQCASLTRMYRQLAEFYLVENEELALRILASIGNNFEAVCLDTSENLDTKPSRNFLLKAKRKFEKILSTLLSGDGDKEKCRALILSRHDGDKCVDFLLQKTNFLVEWTCAYGLFEYLFKDFDSAGTVFKTVFNKIEVVSPLSRSTKYDWEVVNLHQIREQLYITWCKIGARALSKNLMMNSKFRQVLGMALEEFPSSPPLLLIFTDVENQCSIAGKLWRQMVAIVKQESPSSSALWAPLFMGFGLARRIEEIERDEEIGLETFGLGGPAVPLDTIFYKLDSLLSAAEVNIATRNCPLIWRVHLKLLALRAKKGKDEKRAKTVLYNAIRHCPSAKSLFLDGVTYFPEMMQEMCDLMAEKQLLVRLPLQELDVLMEIEEEAKTDNEPIKDSNSTTQTKLPEDTVTISDGEVSD